MMSDIRLGLAWPLRESLRSSADLLRGSLATTPKKNYPAC
jgi:hypothetical protein